MKMEHKALPTSSNEENLVSNKIQSKKVLNLSGIVKRYSNKEYCFKISCKDLQLIKSLKKQLQTNFSENLEIHSDKAYYDRRIL